MKMSGAGLRSARAAGAVALATPCPLCHLVMDVYQGKAEKAVRSDLDVPILHLSQLVGLAFGIDPARLGLKRHMVSTKPVVRALREMEVVKA